MSFASYLLFDIEAHAKLFPTVMKRAANKLADTFGLNLVSVDPKKGTYLISNTLLAGTC